jgi:hypothetical protein
MPLTFESISTNLYYVCVYFLYTYIYQVLYFNLFIYIPIPKYIFLSMNVKKIFGGTVYF